MPSAATISLAGNTHLTSEAGADARSGASAVIVTISCTNSNAAVCSSVAWQTGASKISNDTNDSV